MERDINFDPRNNFQTMQVMNLKVGDSDWQTLTAEEQERQSKHGNESLIKKYRT